MNRISYSIILLACGLLCLSGCGHGSGDGGHGGHDTSHGTHVSEDPGSEDHGSGDHGSEDHGSGDSSARDSGPGVQLALNDGEKWQVDEHTRMSAGNLESLMEGSKAIQSVEEARALATELDEELDSLVQGCTMTGPAHDQLHVFLMAVIPRVAKLQGEADVESLRGTQEEIGSLLEAYSNHFE